MRTQSLLGLTLAILWSSTAGAQGMMSDVLSGALVNPEVGAFAWYNLHDNATGKTFYLRQAIVGEERVRWKKAHWLETELTPEVGYPSVYKMLLTGPANDPDNVHRLLIREGDGPVQEVDLEQDGAKEQEKPANVPKKSVGIETIALPGGNIEAEHFVLTEGGVQTDLWISDQVPPMGLVKMKTPQGELTLQRYGIGGKDGESAIPAPAAEDEAKDDEKADRDNETNDRVRTNFGGRRRGK